MTLASVDYACKLGEMAVTCDPVTLEATTCQCIANGSQYDCEGEECLRFMLSLEFRNMLYFSVQTVKISVSISASGPQEASTAHVTMVTSCKKMEQHAKV